VKPHISSHFLTTEIIPIVHRILPFLALATIPFCFLCLVTSISDLRTYPGVDLRPKVVGARLLAAGLDPYDSEENLPQDDYFRKSGPVTYTPALLALYVPLSALPFAMQRMIYFGLDWLCVAATFYLLQRHFCRTRLERYSCWIFYAAYIVCSYSFRLHLERGQYYTLLLLLTCHAAASIKNKRAEWLSCVPTGLLLLLRPTYGLMLIAALICFGARKWALRVTIVAALMFFVTLEFGGVQRWFSFIHVAHEVQLRHLAEITTNCNAWNGTQSSLKPGTNVFEHIDFQKMLNSHSMNGTFIGCFSVPFVRAWRALSPVCGVLSPKWISSLNSTFMILVLAGGIAVAYIAKRRIVSRNTLIAFMVLWPSVFEIFGPERFFYTAVLTVLPLLLLLLDPDNFNLNLLGTPRLYFLTAVLGLGLLSPMVFQLMYNLSVLRGSALVASFVTLLVPCFCE